MFSDLARHPSRLLTFYKGSTGAALGASPDLKGEKNAQPSEQGKITGTLGSKRIMHAALSRRSDSLFRSVLTSGLSASPVATARSRSPLPPASAKSSDPVPTEGEKAREMLHVRKAI